MMDKRERLKQVVDAIEQDYLAIDKLKESIAEEVDALRESIAWKYRRALEDHGLDKVALKTVIQVRRIESEVRRVASGAQYDQIRLTLGDLAGTPLGQYAETKMVEAAKEWDEPKKKRGRPAKLVEVETVPTVAPHTYASDVTG